MDFSAKNFMSGKPMMNLDFLIDEVMHNRIKLDWQVCGPGVGTIMRSAVRKALRTMLLGNADSACLILPIMASLWIM